MHPTVLAWWLHTETEDQPAWQEQRAAVLRSAMLRRQWGTIASEPGSGGDMLRTRTIAEPIAAEHAELPGRCYRLTGDKHFGSGFGVSDYMFTTARVTGEGRPAAFFIDVRRHIEEGSEHLRVTSEWDGAGMKATQSHAVRLDSVEAVRLAWDGPIDTLAANAGAFVATMFTAVVLGVADEAVATAKAQLGPRSGDLRAFEQVEWARAELEHWLAVQAYEGALRAIEDGQPLAALHSGDASQDSHGGAGQSPASVGSQPCSAAGPTPSARPSPTGSRTSAPSASSDHHGAWRSTDSSARRSTDRTGRSSRGQRHTPHNASRQLRALCTRWGVICRSWPPGLTGAGDGGEAEARREGRPTRPRAELRPSV